MSSPAPNPRLALFDMDGTLLPWDTQYLFSCYVVTRHAWRRLFILFFIACLPLYLLRILSENCMKRIYLSYLWRMPAEQVKKYGEDFAAELETWIYPELLRRLQAHAAAGAECVLVSASPSFYAEPLGWRLGFHAVLGTDIILEEKMPLMPRLVYGNNKGAVKVERLRALGLLPEQSVREDAVAYSDSMADYPMLAATGARVLVNPGKSFKKVYRLNNTEQLFPPRPWGGRLKKCLLVLSYALGLKKGIKKREN